MSRVRTWGDVLEDVRRAIAAADWEAGERAVETLRREAEHHGDPKSLASAAFYAGMFHDARGALPQAEAAFGEAASWDERAHGADHPAVADAWRSIAIVQKRRQRWDAAVATYERAAAVYARNAQPAVAADCLRGAAETRMTEGRLDDAFRRYGSVVASLAGATDAASRVERIHARVGQSECMRRGREHETAYTLACEATREGTPPGDAAMRTALSYAWHALAVLCRHAFHREEEAVLAYALARDLTSRADVRASARKAIAESGHAELARAPIEGAVVATISPRGWAGVFDPERGAIVAEGAEGHGVGDRVRLVRESDAARYRIARDEP